MITIQDIELELFLNEKELRNAIENNDFLKVLDLKLQRDCLMQSMIDLLKLELKRKVG